eukprot:GILI01015248.1.p1 GENE.GILI01015248.1~~GILI01015248.1.p1  ORF type:complete len:928 (-),score=128.38 GILI01015248.1:57-2573(-)
MITPTVNKARKSLESGGKPMLSPKRQSQPFPHILGHSDRSPTLMFSHGSQPPKTTTLNTSDTNSLERFNALVTSVNEKENTAAQRYLKKDDDHQEGDSMYHIDGLGNDAYGDGTSALHKTPTSVGGVGSSPSLMPAHESLEAPTPHPCILVADEEGLRSIGIEIGKRLKGHTNLLPPSNDAPVFRKLSQTAPNAAISQQQQHQKLAFLAALRNVRRVEIVTGIKRGIPAHLLGATAPDSKLLSPGKDGARDRSGSNSSRSATPAAIHSHVKPTPAELVRSAYSPVRHIRLLRVDLYIDGDLERQLNTQSTSPNAFYLPKLSSRPYMLPSPDLHLLHHSNNRSVAKKVDLFSVELTLPALRSVLEASLGKQNNLVKLEVSSITAYRGMSSQVPHSLLNNSSPKFLLFSSLPGESLGTFPTKLSSSPHTNKRTKEAEAKATEPIEIDDILSGGMAYPDGTVLSPARVPRDNEAIVAMVSAAALLPSPSKGIKDREDQRSRDDGSEVQTKRDTTRSVGPVGDEISSPSFIHHPISGNLSMGSSNGFQMSGSNSNFAPYRQANHTPGHAPPLTQAQSSSSNIVLPPLHLKPALNGLGNSPLAHDTTVKNSAAANRWVKRVCFICASGPSASVPQELVERANAALMHALNTKSASATRIISVVDCSHILPEILSAIETQQQNLLFGSAGATAEKHGRQQANEGAWDTIEEEDRRAALLNLADPDTLDVITRESEGIRKRFTQRPVKESPRKNGDDEVLEEQFMVSRGQLGGMYTTAGGLRGGPTAIGTKRGAPRSTAYNNPFSSHTNAAARSNFGAVENQRLQRRLEMLREPDVDPFQSQTRL